MTAEMPFNAAANIRREDILSEAMRWDAIRWEDRPEPEALWQEISGGGDIGKVKALLDSNPEALHHPARFSENYLSGDKAIHIACRYGRPEIVALLLSRGAGLEDLNKPEGSTPLFAAAQASQFAVLDLLLERGANIETRDKKNSTPLWYAAKEGHAPAVDYLLGHGADIEATGRGNVTPLVVALQEKKFGVALSLVSHGANSDACNEAGMTAFQLAERDSPDVFNRMLEKKQEEIAAAKAALRDDIDRAAHQGVDMSGKLKAPMQFVRRKSPG